MIDSVSVEQFDWSAESKVLFPAEHLWSDFKCRPRQKLITNHHNKPYVINFSLHQI